MNTFTFVLPPNSPLQRTLSTNKRSQWLWTMLVVVGIHLVLFGSFLLQGWRRQNGLLSPAGGVAAVEQAMFGGLAPWPKTERASLGAMPGSAQALDFAPEPGAASSARVPAGQTTTLADGFGGSTVTQSLSSSEYASATSEYVVKSGDSLSRIAKVHGLTVKEIWAANDLKTDRLSIGQKLVLPAPGEADASDVAQTAAD